MVASHVTPDLAELLVSAPTTTWTRSYQRYVRKPPSHADHLTYSAYVSRRSGFNWQNNSRIVPVGIVCRGAEASPWESMIDRQM